MRGKSHSGKEVWFCNIQALQLSAHAVLEARVATQNTSYFLKGSRRLPASFFLNYHIRKLQCLNTSSD